MNQENPYGMGLDSRAEHLRALALGLLLDECLDVAELFLARAEVSSDSSSVVTRVVLSAVIPAFEFEFRSPRTPEPRTAARVRRLAELLTTGKPESFPSPA